MGRSSDSRAWGAGKGGRAEGLAQGQACQGHCRARLAAAPPPPPSGSPWRDPPPPPRFRACHALGRGFPSSRLFPAPLVTLTGLAPRPTPSALAAPSSPRGPSLGAGWWAWGPGQAEALGLPIRDWNGCWEGPHRGLGQMLDLLNHQSLDLLSPSRVPGILHCLAGWGEGGWQEQNLRKYLF